VAESPDPIRIVPVRGIDPIFAPATGAPATAPPKLIYNGGPLLIATEVFTFFWGSAWQQQPQSNLVNQLNGFFDFILTSALIDQLAEYNVKGYTIGHGKRVGTATITSSSLGHSVSAHAIQHTLEHQIATNPAFPQPNPNLLYFVYLQQGVSVSLGGARSGQAFCGYHDQINHGQIYYAVMPYPSCNGCLGGLSVLDALTGTSSHELCEAITDAIPGRGWYDQANGEIGDICAWKFKNVGQYNVQLEWSNKAKACA
jgi:hypothetical protein